MEPKNVDEESLLDAGDVECAWSEGGDSLLDSEEEKDGGGEECSVEEREENREQRDDGGEERDGRMINLSLQSPLSDGPPPPPIPLPLTNSPLNTTMTTIKKSRVIHLDGKKKFRYVSDSLPDVPLPRRALAHKKPVLTRPRRITKPSLLLESRRTVLSEPNSDLRNTIVANRMSQLKKTGMARIAGCTGSGSVGMRTVTSDETCTQRASEEYNICRAIASNSHFTTKTSPYIFSQTPSQPALTDTHKCGLSIAQTDSLCEPGLQPATHTPLSLHNTLFSKPVVQHRATLATDGVQRGLFGGSSEPVTTSSKTFTHLPQSTHSASLFEKTPVFSQHNYTPWLHTLCSQASQPKSHVRCPSSSPSPFNTASPTQHHGDWKVNPFYARMRELPQNPSSPDEDINPFLTALQKDVIVSTHQNAIRGFPSSPTSSQQFSFSLAQITS